MGLSSSNVNTQESSGSAVQVCDTGFGCPGGATPCYPDRWLRHNGAWIGELMGQRNLAVTANTYTHVLVDESEIVYAALTER